MEYSRSFCLCIWTKVSRRTSALIRHVTDPPHTPRITLKYKAGCQKVKLPRFNRRFKIQERFIVNITGLLKSRFTHEHHSSKRYSLKGYSDGRNKHCSPNMGSGVSEIYMIDFFSYIKPFNEALCPVNGGGGAILEEPTPISIEMFQPEILFCSHFFFIQVKSTKRQSLCFSFNLSHVYFVSHNKLNLTKSLN